MGGYCSTFSPVRAVWGAGGHGITRVAVTAHATKGSNMYSLEQCAEGILRMREEEHGGSAGLR